MKTTPLEILKIHTLTQGQYERALEEGRINDNELYLTPNEFNDLSWYATKDELKEYAVNKAGDKMKGNLSIETSNAVINLQDTNVNKVGRIIETENTLILQSYNSSDPTNAT